MQLFVYLNAFKCLLTPTQTESVAAFTNGVANKLRQLNIYVSTNEDFDVTKCSNFKDDKGKCDRKSTWIAFSKKGIKISDYIKPSVGAQSSPKQPICTSPLLPHIVTELDGLPGIAARYMLSISPDQDVADALLGVLVLVNSRL